MERGVYASVNLLPPPPTQPAAVESLEGLIVTPHRKCKRERMEAICWGWEILL